MLRVTEDMSRISRDFADSASIFKRLQWLSVPLIGVADGIDTSARHAKMAFTLKSLMSDMYLDDLRDKTMRGLEGRALAGFSTGGMPTGYTSVPEVDSYGRTIGHRIVIDEPMAKVVRRIFQLYLDGQSYEGIARKFNAEKVPPPRAKTRHRRKGWAMETVRSILRNKAYVGEWSFKKKQWLKLPGTNTRRYRKRPEEEIIRRTYPERRIVDPETWEAAQERLKAVHDCYTKKRDGSPKGQAGSGRANAYVLSGLLRCGECNAPMTIAAGTHARYYRCVDNKKCGTCTNRLSLREDVAREKILAAVKEHYTSPSGVARLRKRLAELLGEASRQTNTELDDRRARLERTEQKIAGLIHFISEGEQSEYIRKTLTDLESQAKSEKVAIGGLLRNSAKPIVLPSPDALKARWAAMEDLLQREPVRARELLREMFGGALHVKPQPEGHYVAESRLFPLALLHFDLTPEGEVGTEMTKARPLARSGSVENPDHTDVWSRGGCAGGIRWVDNEVFQGFREPILP